jgi:hypothetical protein
VVRQIKEVCANRYGDQLQLQVEWCRVSLREEGTLTGVSGSEVGG